MNAVDGNMILKQDPATAGIPIVVLTATTLGTWKTRALKAGVAKYLISPSLASNEQRQYAYLFNCPLRGERVLSFTKRSAPYGYASALRN